MLWRKSFNQLAELMLSERGRIVRDRRTNSYIITDIPHAIKQLRRLLSEVDTPTRQVMIEARIVEVTDISSLNLGIQWGAICKTRDHKQ